MKIVVLAGDCLQSECVPLHRNHGDRGAAGAGLPGGPDRLIFRPGDGRGGRGVFLTRLCPRPTRKSAARPGSGSGAARPEGGQPQHVPALGCWSCAGWPTWYSGPPRHLRRGRPGAGRLRSAGNSLHRRGLSGQRHRHGQGPDQAPGGRRGESPRLEESPTPGGHRPTGRDWPACPWWSSRWPAAPPSVYPLSIRRRSCAGPH